MGLKKLAVALGAGLLGSPAKRLVESARRGAAGPMVNRLIDWRNRWAVRRCVARNSRRPGPPPLEPVWPLPRCANGPSEDEIRARFEAPHLWHYDFRFEGGLQFSARHACPRPYDRREQQLRKFRHVMPWAVQAAGGTLEGKRVLDIGCNSGFWSVQCALLGAREVVGFDARPELVEQAKFICAIVGLDQVELRVLDFWDMTPETLGGSFDLVLNLGILYLLPDPLEVLKRTGRMAHGSILLDTMLHRSDDCVIHLDWSNAADICSAATPGVVAWPSKPAVELMLRHLGLSRYLEIPVRTMGALGAYATGRRAAWLIDAGEAAARSVS